jgi:hypothetical protein
MSIKINPTAIFNQNSAGNQLNDSRGTVSGDERDKREMERNLEY